MEPALEIIRRDVLALGLPLRSVEVEFGPEPVRIHLPANEGADGPPTNMVLFRSAVKQIAPPPRLSRDLHVPAETAECVSRSGWHSAINRWCRARMVRMRS